MTGNLIKLAETEHDIIFGTTDGSVRTMARECWAVMDIPSSILAPDWQLIRISPGMSACRIPDSRRSAGMVTIELRKLIVAGHMLRCNFDLAMKVWIVAGEPIKIPE